MANVNVSCCTCEYDETPVNSRFSPQSVCAHTRLTCIRAILSIIIWGVYFGFYGQKGYSVPTPTSSPSPTDWTFKANPKCINDSLGLQLELQLISTCQPQSTFDAGCDYLASVSSAAIISKQKSWLDMIVMPSAFTTQIMALCVTHTLPFIFISNLLLIGTYVNFYLPLTTVFDMSLCFPFITNDLGFRIHPLLATIGAGCSISLKNKSEFQWAKQVVAKCQGTTIETTSNTATLLLEWLSSPLVIDARWTFNKRMDAMIIVMLIVAIISWFLVPISFFKHVCCVTRHAGYSDLDNGSVEVYDTKTQYPIPCACCIHRKIMEQHVLVAPLADLIILYVGEVAVCSDPLVEIVLK
jgi:hypothetical protein